jgi:lysophospholipase L1-like esterase
MVTPKILLALAALLAPLGLSEAIMRVEGYQPLGALADGRAPILTVSSNPDMVYALTPGSHGTAWGCDVQINSHGFRDREYSLTPPDGVFRIIVLGDSITFGNHMPASATFTEQLEARLADRNVEVLNFGVGGYDTLNEAALLEEQGVDFEPDLVIIGYCINDVGVYSTNLTYIRSLERYSSAIYNLRVFQYMGVQADRQQLAEDMAAANEGDDFQKRYAGRIADVSGDTKLAELQSELVTWVAGHPEPGRGHGFIGSYTEPARVGRIRHGLEWIQDIAREHGFRTLLVPIPLLHEAAYPRAYDLVHEIVEREGRRAGMDVLTVRDAFDGLTAQDLKVRDRDMVHLNPFGHKILAEELEAWLRQNEFLIAQGE